MSFATIGKISLPDPIQVLSVQSSQEVDLFLDSSMVWVFTLSNFDV